MRIAVITCEAYRDCWEPFMAFFRKFWPACKYPVAFYKEHNAGDTWCSVVRRCALEAGEDPILLMQEDFWLNKPVQDNVVAYSLELLESRDAGVVRLYPSPGGTEEIGDQCFAIVPRGTRYRISCHASIWNPEYLAEIARGAMWTTGEAGDFENLGTPHSDTLPQEVLAFKYDVQPWPMDYIASAVGRGKWNPDAIRLCEEHGVPLDRSMRPVQA